jgi:hypothetical protein
LLAVRRSAGGGFYSAAEDPIIADMNDLWLDLDDDEADEIRRQGSWKFGEDEESGHRPTPVLILAAVHGMPQVRRQLRSSVNAVLTWTKAA